MDDMKCHCDKCNVDFDTQEELDEHAKSTHGEQMGDDNEMSEETN